VQGKCTPGPSPACAPSTPLQLAQMLRLTPVSQDPRGSKVEFTVWVGGAAVAPGCLALRDAGLPDQHADALRCPQACTDTDVLQWQWRPACILPAACLLHPCKPLSAVPHAPLLRCTRAMSATQVGCVAGWAGRLACKQPAVTCSSLGPPRMHTACSHL